MQDDFHLLRAYAVSRSQDAFECLVTRHIDMVYSTCLRLLRNPTDAEDATQAVFIALAAKAQSIPPGTVMAGWLYRTATFVAISAARKQRAQRKYEMNAAKDRRTSEEPKLDAAPFDIDRALNRLRADQRQAILLRFFEDRSFAEIARELRLTEEAARKRVSRALERLRELLGAKSTAGTALSASLVEEVLRQSVSHAPTYLTASAGHVATTATTAAGAGTAATSAASLAKGALTLMALSNAKIAASVVVVALLLLGAGAVTYRATYHASPRQVVLDSSFHPVGRAGPAATNPAQMYEQRKRVQSAAHLRQIGLAALLYANGLKSRALPPDLGTLLKEQGLRPDVLLNPRMGTAVPLTVKNAPKAEQARWVNEHSDYLWLGAGLTSSDNASTIVAAEKADGLSVGVNILYLDGHVEFWAMPNAIPLLNATRDALVKRTTPQTRAAQ